MDRRQLEEKVRESLEEGYSFKEIRTAMIQDGYSRDLVDDILSDFRESDQGAQNQPLSGNQGQNQSMQNQDQNQEMLQAGQDNQQFGSEAESYDQGTGQQPTSSGDFNNNRPQQSQAADSEDKSRKTAAILALLLGALGAHKFYLGDARKGILYLCFFWTMIPGIAALIEGIMYLKASDEEFQKKYVEQQ